MTGAELITAVLDQGGFDGSRREDALGWLNVAYRRMVAKALWRKAELELGPTVAGEARYALPDDVVDVVDLLYTPADGTGPSPWSRTSKTAIWDVKSGRSRLTGLGGVFAPDFDTAGAKFVQLYPVPVTSGDTLTALVASEPGALADDAVAPTIPDDLQDALVDGAISIGLRRVEEMIGEADSYEQRYREAISELAGRANSQVGSRATQVKVAGYHF